MKPVASSPGLELRPLGEELAEVLRELPRPPTTALLTGGPSAATLFSPGCGIAVFAGGERQAVPGASSPARYDLAIDATALDSPFEAGNSAALKALAQSSRDYVVVLAPNHASYWRSASSTCGGGMTACDPAAIIARLGAAGMTPVALRYLGFRQTEALLNGLPGLASPTRDELLQLHRSVLVPADQRALVLAVLGTVHADGERPPVGWLAARPAVAASAEQSLETDAPADATIPQELLAELSAEIACAQTALAAIRDTPTYRISQVIARLARDAVGTCCGAARWLARGRPGSFRTLLESLEVHDPVAEIDGLLRTAARAAARLVEAHAQAAAVAANRGETVATSAPRP